MSEKKIVRIRCKGATTASLEDLNEFQGDLKETSTEEFQQLRRLILKHGWTAPVHVWENGGKRWILDGHRRRLVANELRKEGYTIPPLPINLIEADSLKQAKEILLAHVSQFGKVTEEGLYEFVMQSEIDPTTVFQDFAVPGFDMEHFARGYFKDEAEVHFNSKTGVDEDDVPALPKKPAAKIGDVFELGRHRVVCGDATSEAALKILMDGVPAHAVWTDPPYNVDYEGKSKKRMKIENDKMGDAGFRAFLVAAFSGISKHLEGGGAFYIAHADSEGFNFRGAARDVSLQIRQCLIWKKSSLVIGRQDYQWIHEPILYGWKEGASHHWFSDRKQTTVLEFNRPPRNDLHPTMKPVELIEYCLGNSTGPGNIVLDPFGGSGSTLIACEKIERSARILELDPGYVDVIVKRWEKYTGQKAKRITPGGPTGKTRSR